MGEARGMPEGLRGSFGVRLPLEGQRLVDGCQEGLRAWRGARVISGFPCPWRGWGQRGRE